MAGRRQVSEWIAAGLAGAALLAVAPVSATSPSADPTAIRVVHPLNESAGDTRYKYDWTVLRIALEKSAPRFGPFMMAPAEDPMSRARVTAEMARPDGRINIFVRGTSIDLEKRFLPVRIPVDRGILGYRVFLLKEADRARLEGVRTLDDLRALRIGQGKDWADLEILRAAGLNTIEAKSYDGLFSMLMAGRFDLFPRAVDEIYREVEERRATHPDLAVDSHLLLYYPLPRYFFVRRDAEGERLAARIEAGLEIMLRDGTLETLFRKYKGPVIEQAKLGTRRILRIPNPYLTPETPLGRRELWFDPFAAK